MKNVKSPDKFQQKLAQVMDGIYDLMEMSKEYNLEQTAEDGCIRYTEEEGKTCFQVSGQFDRPSEYLEALLDLVRVNFEPCVMGTFFLNSNMCFLYDAVPDAPFQLGYVSITSESDKPFGSFWIEDVVPYINRCGYFLGDASSIFAIASTGREKYDLPFVGDVTQTLSSGFSSDEALALMFASLDATKQEPTKRTYAGFCLDAALGRRTRLSLWLFMNPETPMIQ